MKKLYEIKAPHSTISMHHESYPKDKYEVKLIFLSGGEFVYKFSEYTKAVVFYDNLLAGEYCDTNKE